VSESCDRIFTMGYRINGFERGGVYHIFTRGVEKREIFMDHSDRVRFISQMIHCLPDEPILNFSHAQKLKRKLIITSEGEGLADILCYCLMNNHVHFLLRENVDGGISRYMQRLLNSFARYFNVKYERTGALFAGPFRSVPVVSDDQLLHVSRYIHLNPHAAHIVKDVFAYPWSSLRAYLNDEDSKLYCHADFLASLMDKKEYKKFVFDQVSYEQSLAAFPELLLDDDYT